MRAHESHMAAGFKAGDAKSLAYVFNLFNERLLFFADSLIGNRQDAQDIVQEAFAKLWQKRSQFEGVDNIGAYLYISIRNACFDHLRKNKRELEIRKELSSFSETTFTEDEVMRAEVETELIQMVFEEVKKLPKQCRTIFEMILYDNLSTAEISGRLRITKRNVLNQKARAIKLLQIAILKRKLLLLFCYFLAKACASAIECIHQRLN